MIAPEAENLPAEPQKPELPDETHLENKMPEWFQAPRTLAAFTVFAGLIYCFLNYQPLWHTDLWGHLSYGRLISQTGILPTTEPLMPLAAGVAFVDTAWLSQTVGYAAYQYMGAPAIQFLYGATITFSLSLLLWRSFRRTRNLWLSLAAGSLFLWVDWQQLFIVRPQLAGLACFMILVSVLTSRRWTRLHWLGIPVLFALWANLHGSFVVGLATLGCFLLGRSFDLFRRTGKLKSLIHDRRLFRYFLLTELAAVATLLNPYGLGLYGEVLTISASPNLVDLVEWKPLHLQMLQGQAAACLALALILVYRFSPRRVVSAEFLLLAGLGAAALWMSRMILWWAPLAAYFLVLHGNAVWRHFRRNHPAPAPSPSNSTWAVASIGLVWIFFAYTPFGVTLLHGEDADVKENLSAVTPVGAVAYLREHPPQGQIFNTYEWGDYLLWAGPKDLQVFTASHAHLIPAEVWKHYMYIINLGSGWEELLDRYSVNTIIIDTRHRKTADRQTSTKAELED